MQTQAKREVGYKLQPAAATGGFLPQFLQQDPTDDETKCCGQSWVFCFDMTRFKFEPSPLTAGIGGRAFFGLLYGLILHILAIVFTTYAATWGLKGEKHLTTNTHTVDFVSSWLWVAVAGQWVSTGIVLVYYGLFHKASKWPWPGSVALGLQLASVVSNIKLAYFAAVDDRAHATLNVNCDWAIVVGMYVQLLLIGGFIMTPISGTYYKVKSMPL